MFFFKLFSIPFYRIGFNDRDEDNSIMKWALGRDISFVEDPRHLISWWGIFSINPLGHGKYFNYFRIMFFLVRNLQNDTLNVKSGWLLLFKLIIICKFGIYPQSTFHRCYTCNNINKNFEMISCALLIHFDFIIINS